MVESLCPKCQGKMVQGFVPDYAHQAALVGTWHEGQPKQHWWRGIKVKGDGSGGIPIGAFRCSGCGYVELYADARFAAQ